MILRGARKGNRGSLRALGHKPSRYILPFLTQVVLPTVTVKSVKKFQRTYPPVTVPPSSVLSPSDKRTTPAP
jgi:hypothetical protein